jgi:hypothetical protein
VPRGWDMLLDDLRRRRPRLILDTSTGDYGFSNAQLDRYPALAEYVHAHYREDATVAGVRVYTRTD